MRRAVNIILFLMVIALSVEAYRLYFIPEQEIAFGENTVNTETSKASDISMPVFALDDAEIRIGETKVSTLLNAGFTLKFSKDGKIHDISSADKIADAYNRYQVQIYKKDSCIADITYTNRTAEKQDIGSCVVDQLVFNTQREGFSAAKITADGIDVTSMKIEDIPQKFTGFEKTNAAYPEYRKAVMTLETSVIADFSARGSDQESITDFGIRNYLSSGTG